MKRAITKNKTHNAIIGQEHIKRRAQVALLLVSANETKVASTHGVGGKIRVATHCLNLARNLLTPTTFVTPVIPSAFTYNTRVTPTKPGSCSRANNGATKTRLRRPTRTLSLYMRWGSLTMRHISPLAGKREYGSSMRTCALSR